MGPMSLDINIRGSEFLISYQIGTHVVEAIIGKLGHMSVAIIQHDSYYRHCSHLHRLEREKVNYDHLDALETQLLIYHLKELAAGRKVEVPVYDFSTHTREKVRKPVLPFRTIAFEGIDLLTNKNLRELMNIKIFVDTDDGIRFIRRLQRDIKETSEDYGACNKNNIWIP
jgi:uridine kinase